MAYSPIILVADGLKGSSANPVPKYKRNELLFNLVLVVEQADNEPSTPYITVAAPLDILWTRQEWSVSENANIMFVRVKEMN